MHNTYVDRGIIKWAPFDALVGFHGILQDLRHRMGRKDKPVLSDDQYDELNQTLNLAFHLNLEVEICYYNDGYTQHTLGKIKKIDWVKRMILLTSFERIYADDILSLHFLESS